MILLLALASSALSPGVLCTPASADFAGRYYPAKIALCTRNVTEARKRAVFARYGVPLSERAAYEVDHRIPICMGGANDLGNLFPQAWPDAKRKDVLEKQLCASLRAGRIAQGVAVKKMREWK